MAPDSTLVLLNGKRRHRSAVISFLGGGISDGAHGPDISVIPSIALKQVEVLRDGASSQYGSDAIAGVINFVLRDDAEGATIEGEWGQTYEGDGDRWQISANMGFPLKIAQGGFLNLSAELSEVNDTIRSVQRDDAAALIAAGNTAVGDISVNTVTSDVAQIWGQPNVNDDLSLFVNIGIDLNDNMELYTFGNYAQRQVEGGFFFRNPTNRGGVFAGPTVDPITGALDPNGVASVRVGDLSGGDTGDCPAGIPLTDGGGLIPDPTVLAQVNGDANCFAFTEIAPGGFTPRFGGDLEDRSVVAGIRGELPIGNGLRYDVSYTFGENKVAFFINNTVNASLGPNTPRDFFPGAYAQSDNNFNIDLAYGVPNNMFASDIGIAVGFEHRKETFDITQGDDASFAIGPLAAPSSAYPNGQGFSSSSNGFGGFTPASAGANSQNNYALYFETETDITDSLIFQAAVRYEDFYDSFGDTLNYKLGVLYSVNEDWSLRSTYSTGFHAPTAGQANVTNITTAFSGSQLVDQGTIPLSSAAGQFIADRLEATTGVRPELGPETSKNFSVGLAGSLGGINMTLDYFNIRVADRISISDQQDFAGALQAAATDAGITVAPGSTTSQLLFALDGGGVLNAADFAGSEDLTSFGFFSNSFDTRTQGIDFVANTDFELYEGSNTNLALAFNWTDTRVTDRGAGGAAPLSLGREEQLEDNLPAIRSSLTMNHYVGAFRGLARVNYWGSYFECHLDALNAGAARGCDLPVEPGAEVTVDLEAAYTVAERFTAIVGAQNVLDTYPDENPFSGIVGAQYPATSPFGFNGGYYYFKIRAEL